ncbi:MAG: hypothetical protein MJE77_03100 [Proteobacteria bacterium]|nr:hypothetical protein [Pseudomonadota bacterium]
MTLAMTGNVPFRIAVRVLRWALASSLALWLVACSATEKRVEQDFNFDGTCVRCHSGLSAGQVHATFKLRCVDCHGGNDQVGEVPENAFENEADWRNQALIAASHDLYPDDDARIAFKDPALARFFFANGIDDDGDGVIDEPIEFDPNNANQVLDFGEIAELGLQGEGVGQFIDTEYNRDLNYTRWINPGDLRVATATCGSSSRVAGETASGCHQSVVDVMRRSIMVNQAAVINGAYYGNESWREAFQQDRDDNGQAADPRAGAYGYPLDYEAIDGCIDDAAVDGQGGRGQPRFDSACLEMIAALNDPAAASGQPGNIGLPAFEAVQGAIEGAAPGTQAGSTLAHQGVFNKSSRFEGWGGQPLDNVEASLPELEPVLNQPLLQLLAIDPVDLVLRGFRAYYPLNYAGSNINQNFTFGESIQPNLNIIQTKNPFGRGHSSGCTACHMAYNYDGSRNPQLIQVVDENGNASTESVTDPTTKHREFDVTQDIVAIDGQDRLIGITVNAAERDVDKDGDLNDAVDREQQRFYSADHELTTRITTQQCGLCHAFVTRIDLAYQGMSEDEQRDALARIAPIDFTTPEGTRVRIHDSLVREEFDATGANFERLVIPSGVPVIEQAKQRDATLAQAGLIAGAGGCAPQVYTEDCNNNGELDGELVLTWVDENGNTVATETIDEDLNRNGVLDLIDHAPREVSVDGRQMRYIYGGRNGSTRLMDIHFERGMHCIDCHMLQDSHGDGNLYSTNWDTIEIECEDCHGTVQTPASLLTTGPNGGNDLTLAEDHDRRPFFERKGDRIIQRSRVTPGLFWQIPQTADVINPDSQFFNADAIEAHTASHLPADDGQTSVFAGDAGQSPLQQAKLECYSCHMSWVINCIGCHYNVNRRIGNRKSVDENGVVKDVAGENEVWYNNSNQFALTNFQLLAFMRSPFILGYNATADEQRVGTFRSSMQLHVSVNDAAGDTLFDNITFTTHQRVDGNSERSNVATSGAALNQTMPHTVRPLETRSCEQCHALVDRDGAIRNDHIVAETYGIGAGRYPWAGDWAFMVGGASMEVFEYKNENQLIPNNRFPGIIVNGSAADRIPALVAGNPFPGPTTDAVLIRNFNPEPASPGETALPTLTDIVAVTFNNGAAGGLVLIDVTGRGRAGTPTRPTLPQVGNVLNLTDNAHAIVHLAPDVSDPLLYIANGAAGLTTVKITATGIGDAGLGGNAQFTTDAVSTVQAPGGQTLIELVLAGDILYAGTQEGTIEVFTLANPAQPAHLQSINAGGGQVNGLAIAGFFLYAATANGIAILELTDNNGNVDLTNPRVPTGGNGDVLAVPGIDARELFYSAGHLYVAAGVVLDIDVTVPAKPVNLGNVVDKIAPGETVTTAVDVIVSKVPVQTWLLIAEANGSMVGLKLDNRQSTRERCLVSASQNPVSLGCGLDMDWRDPTIMGRDPTFINGAFDAADPSGPPFFRLAPQVNAAARRLARPAQWEKMNTHTGRRYRDSFMPGSGTLSLEVMARMYAVRVCETDDIRDINGNGLGVLGYANDSGGCDAFPETPTGQEETALAGAVGSPTEPIMCVARPEPGVEDSGMCLP